MTTLYFDVLVKNYSCLRIVSYFSSKIRLGEIPLVADFGDQLSTDGQRSCVSRTSYVRLSLLVYFEDQLSADCHWWRILRISYMATLHFEQNAS